MQKDSGFTLAELMVVIAIVAIVSAIAVPNLIGWLPKYRLGSAASKVLSAIEYGRLAAVKENASVGLSFNTATDNFTLWIDNGDGGGTKNDVVQNGTEKTIRNGQIPPGIDMTAAAFDVASRFRINARGLPIKTDGTPGGGAVTLINARGDVRSITISNGGNCKIQ